MKVIKTEGVNQFNSKTISTMIRLPLFEANGEYLASSCVGQIMSVQYFIRFFVKHSSISEFGEGHCVSLPIWVCQPYRQESIEKSKIIDCVTAATEELNLPNDNKYFGYEEYF